MEIWRRNQVAVTAASFVGFTGFTMVMPFLALSIQELGVTDVGAIESAPSVDESSLLVDFLLVLALAPRTFGLVFVYPASLSG